MVDLVEPATPAGSSLRLGDLNNVAAGADTAAAGMLLGTTSTGQWGPVTAGASGGAGEVRPAWAPPADYIGTAAAGTAETAAGWTVARITVAPSGAVVTATAQGTWVGRESLTYG
jgi:hypothetical protein